MRVGVYVFATDLDLDPGPLAFEIEARGFDSLFFPEHSHIPVARATAYPKQYGGGELPDFYKRTYDPFISCSFAAAATTTLEVGTGVTLLALRDTMHTAKMAASIDRLSGGRFAFGVGFGWNEDEFATHSADFTRRHRKVREQVAAIRTIWTDDVVEFHGDFVDIAPSWCWPKPAQSAPKVYLGGSGPLTMKHAAEWADVWYPTPPMTDPYLDEAAPAFRALVESNGRDPSTVGIGIAPAACDAHGLERYAENGVDLVNIALVADSPAAMLSQLDDLHSMRVSVLGR
ncbi:LLM class F420-dependent oxidoreductase [Cnuibacter physcomitrellae]|uniref:LLM class F420-dependent oxidoreductase n=1 Tax=Cnuibacter physcomitrellae TaxID=1619308 RepID=UPI00157CEB65|nr:LLM class F420-dependent oxidoreductase [Cnuibacter physcomitrellae]GGI42588.1 LLM class F420-dependent oxidoreductase [Cnuibacter physcomitrellae]